MSEQDKNSVDNVLNLADFGSSALEKQPMLAYMPAGASVTKLVEHSKAIAERQAKIDSADIDLGDGQTISKKAVFIVLPVLADVQKNDPETFAKFIKAVAFRERSTLLADGLLNDPNVKNICYRMNYGLVGPVDYAWAGDIEAIIDNCIMLGDENSAVGFNFDVVLGQLEVEDIEHMNKIHRYHTLSMNRSKILPLAKPA